MLRRALIFRRFNVPPTKSELRKASLKYNAVYFGIIGAFIGCYKLYTYKVDPPKERNQRTIAIKNTMTKRPAYIGLKRDEEVAKVLNLLESDQITVVYSQPKSGISNFLARFQSAAPIERPVLYLQIKDSIENTVNQFEFDNRLGNSHFNKFMDNVYSAIENPSGIKSLIIIDGIEKLDPLSKNNLNTQILHWKRLNKADVLIGTSQISNIDYLQSSNLYSEQPIKIHILNPLSESEFTQALLMSDKFTSKSGVNSDFEARLLYKDVGPFFDIALEYAESDLSLASNS